MLFVILGAAGILAAAIGLWAEPMFMSVRFAVVSAGDEAEGTPLEPDETMAHDYPTNTPAALIPLAGSAALHPHPADAERRLIPYWTQAVILQLVLGAVFVSLGIRFGWHGHHSWQLVLACVYAALLFEMAVIDFHYRLILNLLSYPAAVVALAGSLAWYGIGPTSALLGGACALVVFFLIELFGRGGMARGDTKLAVVIGLMRGYPAMWAAIVLGIFVGGIMAFGLLLSGRSRKTTFAYGPALAIGAVASFFIGKT